MIRACIITGLAVLLICSVALNAAQFFHVFERPASADAQASFKAAMNLGDLR